MCEAAQQTAWQAEAKGGPGSDLWPGQGTGTQEGWAGRGGGGARVWLGGRVREHHSWLATPSVRAEPQPGPRTAIQELRLLDTWAQPRRKRPRQRLRGLPEGPARRRPRRPLPLAGERLARLGCVHSTAGQRPGPAQAAGHTPSCMGPPPPQLSVLGKPGWGTRIADPACRAQPAGWIPGAGPHHCLSLCSEPWTPPGSEPPGLGPRAAPSQGPAGEAGLPLAAALVLLP